ncbi:hypothetical protein G5V59_21920 [Nocardioides sp. W3-2-3]|uniref:hypothetical protein n=1 Tax=Nocardioides convexus TaxID=2712224 RepID=UPI002418BB50|nr:hypothetical protein [Nocardioides convexus]NHA01558.1 hypothetical protein [Nocardioides convexus]
MTSSAPSRPPSRLAEACPGDVGVIVSLLLNRLTLQPGEAAYLATGIIHAHLRGLCLEVMVSSDNVLRAGLTTKHIDAPGLVRCLEEGTSRAARVEPMVFNYSTDVFSPCGDFALSVTQSSPADPAGVVLPATGARLLVCTGGEVALVNRRDEVLRLGRGEVAYADGTDGEPAGRRHRRDRAGVRPRPRRPRSASSTCCDTDRARLRGV